MGWPVLVTIVLSIDGFKQPVRASTNNNNVEEAIGEMEMMHVAWLWPNGED